MTFKVLGTNHTSFTVSNLERTAGFFRDCLGFELVSKAPGHTIELIEYRAPAGKGAVQARPCDTGFAHVAFNVDDAAAAVAAAQNKGRRVVYVRDWDGVTLELIEAAAR